MIAVDDLNSEVGFLGSKIAQTPNLDRLANRSLVFRRAYVQQALCNPSRASLLTGKSPDTLRIWNLTTHFRDTHPELVTLPQKFKQRGYFTQGIGKVFHNWGKMSIEGDPQSWSAPQTYHYAPHFSDWHIPGAPQGTPAEKQAEATQCVDVPDETYFDGRIAQEAIRTLREHRSEPFFLAVGFWKPHLPFNAPKKFWDLYDADSIPDPAPTDAPSGAPAIAMHNYRELRGYTDMPKEGSPTAEQVRRLRHGYYAAISFVDAQIGKVIDELDRLELSNHTIIVFWSYHGFHLGEHALWAKTSNFERDAHVPLLISSPDRRASGKKTDALVELLDIYPTLVDLAGMTPPEGLEGKSLRPLFENPDASFRAAALTQHPRPPYYKNQPDVMGYSIRTPRFRYTEWQTFPQESNKRSAEVVARELYDHDHDRDPTESVNLADRPEHRERVRELSALLRQSQSHGN
jgi:iduronate 2-sulfatase